MTIKKVLLLGGTGTLSLPVLEQALSCEFEVTIMNRGLRKKAISPAVRVINCDFLNIDEISSKFGHEEFDVIVDFLSRQREDIERIYPFFAKHCKQYIFISSACIYKRDSQDFPICESSPKPNTNWIYNIQKYECENKLIELSSQEDSFFTIVRPYITYDDERIPLGIAPAYFAHRTIIERIKSGKPWFTWDEGSAVTTITHTSDFARAVVSLFLNERAYNEDFHITSGYQCTQKELLDVLFKKLGAHPNYVNFSTEEISTSLPEYSELLKGDRSLSAIFDNSKVLEAIPGFEFKMSIDKGLDRVLSYWMKNSSYCYDYIFEARIDKLISKKTKVGFINYLNAKEDSKKLYYLYRYMPLRLAKKFSRL